MSRRSPGSSGSAPTPSVGPDYDTTRLRPFPSPSTPKLMEFEWDPAKSDACFSERGFDFVYAARIFLDPERRVQRDDRFDYGEARYIVMGRVEGRLLVVVYTPRVGRLRIVSARKANERERRHHDRDADDD